MSSSITRQRQHQQQLLWRGSMYWQGVDPAALRRSNDDHRAWEQGTTNTNLAGDTVPVSARNGLEAYTHRKEWEAEQPTAERVWRRRRGAGSMDRDDPVAVFENLLHDIKRHAAEKPERFWRRTGVSGRRSTTWTTTLRIGGTPAHGRGGRRRG